MGKSTISMAIFNSFLYVYRRVTISNQRKYTQLDFFRGTEAAASAASTASAATARLGGKRCGRVG